MGLVITGLLLAVFCFLAYKLWYVPRGTSGLGAARDTEYHHTDKK